MKKKPGTGLGDRLKKAAHEAGYTAESLAEALGTTSSSAVYAWWSGRNEPPLDMLVLYARTVGKSLEYLATGDEPTADNAGSLADWLFLLVDGVMGGADPGSAFDTVTQRPETLSIRERDSLTRRSNEFRRFVQREAGRPWEELSESERRGIVAELLEKEG